MPLRPKPSRWPRAFWRMRRRSRHCVTRPPSIAGGPIRNPPIWSGSSPSPVPPERSARAAPAAAAHDAAGGKSRALFVPASGIGLGHVARLLAIARRLDDAVEPVFASLGQAGDVIDAFGYRSEYIPSRSDTRAPLSEWDAWFRHDLGEVIDRYEPAVVVFDGNNPTPGLVQAVLAHGACRLVWVRRGMGPETPSPFLDNARFFDCVIEPGEYAAERDTGPTSRLRHEVVQVAADPPAR